MLLDELHNNISTCVENIATIETKDFTMMAKNAFDEAAMNLVVNISELAITPLV